MVFLLVPQSERPKKDYVFVKEVHEEGTLVCDVLRQCNTESFFTDPCDSKLLNIVRARDISRTTRRLISKQQLIRKAVCLPANPGLMMWVRAVWKEPNGEEEGVIPEVWVKDNMVHWPPGANVTKAAKEMRMPASSWKMFPLLKIKFKSNEDESTPDGSRSEVLALHASVPRLNTTELHATVPNLRPTAPHGRSSTLHASAPTLHASAPKLHASAPKLQASAPTLHASAPTLHASAPTLHASAPKLQASAPTLHTIVLHATIPNLRPTAPHASSPALQTTALYASYTPHHGSPSLQHSSQHQPSRSSYEFSHNPEFQKRVLYLLSDIRAKLSEVGQNREPPESQFHLEKMNSRRELKNLEGQLADDEKRNVMKAVEEQLAVFHGGPATAVSPGSPSIESWYSRWNSRRRSLRPRRTVGEVRGQVRLGGSASREVQVNQVNCELREVGISDGKGEVKVTLWDSFIGQVEEGLSYAFKNLSTLDREGFIGLCTGPTSSIEEIADLDVPEEGGGEQNDTSTALFSATIKGIEVRIVRKCSSCRFVQTKFVKRSETHRCEACRLKQVALSFCPSFAGKAILSTAGGKHSVTLTSSALSSYLRGAGLGKIFNDHAAIEDYFLQSAAFDLKVSVDGFLESIHPANEIGSSGTGELWDTDEAEDAQLVRWPEEVSFMRSCE
ncbi:hypothetical protein E1301_Tti019686 [Triplophysa tibetana]|uniref:Uncharacterized protein n=1 Tax=Triplophysa tibetana TaxID=1572043 RepID=A0A5A9PHW2_9TELE|nr:hypothetical protein E1301_Tti019686 [Triplophysa tibetana]